MEETKVPLTLISGFHHDVDKICAVLGYYLASCGNYHMMPLNIPE
jgi:hypothetical protein